MDESIIYQRIVAQGVAQGKLEGRTEVARRILLRLATKRFGPPEGAIRAIIEAIRSIERLERLVETVSEVHSWTELLAEA